MQLVKNGRTPGQLPKSGRTAVRVCGRKAWSRAPEPERAWRLRERDACSRAPELEPLGPCTFVEASYHRSARG